jgi:hypothetical protein
MRTFLSNAIFVLLGFTLLFAVVLVFWMCKPVPVDGRVVSVTSQENDGQLTTVVILTAPPFYHDRFCLILEGDFLHHLSPGQMVTIRGERKEIPQYDSLSAWRVRDVELIDQTEACARSDAYAFSFFGRVYP